MVMTKEWIKEVPLWEQEYLAMSKLTLTDRQKEILNGDSIKTNEGMIYGSMYVDWKKIKGYESN